MPLLVPKKKILAFAYTDYRAYLRDYYADAKAADPKFSQRYISQKVGASSSSWFLDVAKGRVHLSGTHIVKLARLFDLESSEAAYFEALVYYGQAGSPEEKNHHFRKLIGFKEMSAELVGEEKFEYYSKWYYSAVRELLFFHPWSGDFTALARKLEPPIKAAEAKEAIHLLSKLALVKKDAQGCYRPTGATLKKDTSFKSGHAMTFLKGSMELAMEALERFRKEDRHISGMTLSYSEQGYRKALSEIDALRKKLVALLEEDSEPSKVYQLNVQLFPITN